MSAADGRLCRFGNLGKFCYLYVTIEGSARPKRHVQLYRPEQERCSLTDAMPDIDTVTIKRGTSIRKTGTLFPASLWRTCCWMRNEPQRFNPISTRTKEAMLNGLNAWNNGRRKKNGTDINCHRAYTSWILRQPQLCPYRICTSKTIN